MISSANGSIEFTARLTESATICSDQLGDQQRLLTDEWQVYNLNFTYGGISCKHLRKRSVIKTFRENFNIGENIMCHTFMQNYFYANILKLYTLELLLAPFSFVTRMMRTRDKNINQVHACADILL